MTKTFLLAGAAALVFSFTAASAAVVQPTIAAKTNRPFTIPFPHAGLTTLYDQHGTDSGIGIVSDNFDSGSFDSDDNQGVDDFTVPAHHTWIVTEVDATGVYFNGPGPSDSYNVFFWADDGTPSFACCKGAPSFQCPNLPAGGSSSESPQLTLNGCTSPSDGSAPKRGKKVKLKGKKGGTKFYVSVQSNINFSSGAGEWGWENQTEIVGAAAQWENPGDGLGTGCTEFTDVNVWIPDGEGDFMFTLRGTDKAK